MRFKVVELKFYQYLGVIIGKRKRKKRNTQKEKEHMRFQHMRCGCDALNNKRYYGATCNVASYIFVLQLIFFYNLYVRSALTVCLCGVCLCACMLCVCVIVCCGLVCLCVYVIV